MEGDQFLFLFFFCHYIKMPYWNCHLNLIYKETTFCFPARTKKKNHAIMISNHHRHYHFFFNWEYATQLQWMTIPLDLENWTLGHRDIQSPISGLKLISQMNSAVPKLNPQINNDVSPNVTRILTVEELMLYRMV